MPFPKQGIKKGPIEIFTAYSHKDERLRNKLESHLSLLKQQGVITAWHDRKIVPGKDWEKEIDKHLSSAAIILLLISSDFLESTYCYGIEMTRALRRHRAGTAVVIPGFSGQWIGTALHSVNFRPCLKMVSPSSPGLRRMPVFLMLLEAYVRSLMVLLLSRNLQSYALPHLPDLFHRVLFHRRRPAAQK